MSDPNTQQPSLPDWGEPQEDSPTEREENGDDADPDLRGDGSGGGAGSEGTIPDAPNGLAAGVSDEPTTFEPEEDPEAAAATEGEPDADLDDDATELRG